MFTMRYNAFRDGVQYERNVLWAFDWPFERPCYFESEEDIKKVLAFWNETPRYEYQLVCVEKNIFTPKNLERHQDGSVFFWVEDHNAND